MAQAFMSLSIFLTLYFWLFLIFWVGLICVTFVWPFIPGVAGYRDVSHLRYCLARLLRCGYKGGSLRVTHDKSGRFLYFRKYIHKRGDYGLELCCAKPTWSDAERAQVQSLAEGLGLSARQESGTFQGASTETLVIYCGQNTAAAYDLAVAAWSKILGLSRKALHHVDFDDCSSLDELIDRADYPPPVNEVARTRGWDHVEERVRNAGAPSFSKVLLAMLLVPTLLLSAVGLPTTIFLSRGETADWTIQLATMTLGGDTISLIFLSTFLGSCLVLHMLRFRRASWAQYKDTWVKRVFRVLVYSAPFAVLLEWGGF